MPVASHQQHVEIRLLNVLFDAGRPMSVSELEGAVGCIRCDLWNAIRQQHRLGNIRKGQPIELLPSAQIAIAAGRLAHPAALAA